MRQILHCLLVATAVLAAHAQPQIPAPANSKNLPPGIIPPPSPALVCPVTFFRDLLAMSPAERNHSLTNRSPEARARIMAKVREYLALDPDERELRLSATELRWYLLPLFRTAPAERAARLAALPDKLRATAKSRLAQWDLLPPNLQNEFLENDRALHYFTHVTTTNTVAITPEQQKLSEQFNQFFELTPTEKQEALGTLSASERAAMEKTLQSFEKLTPRQRVQCIHNYAKFASLSPAQRAEFLKSAESWSKMSPKERQTWRDLVANTPLWPPIQPAIIAPSIMPPVPAKSIHHSSMATN